MTDAERPQRVCGVAAPDRSGRQCDKPKGHDEHWSYGGNTVTWTTDAAAVRALEAQIAALIAERDELLAKVEGQTP